MFRRALLLVLVSAAVALVPGGDVVLARSGALGPQTLPGMTLSLSGPSVVQAGHLFTLSATVRNTGDTRGYSCTAALAPRVEGYQPLDPYASLDPLEADIGGLDPGAEVIVAWRMRAPLEAQPKKVFTVEARCYSSLNQLELWQVAQVSTYTVGSCGLFNLPIHLSITPSAFTWRGGEGVANVSVAEGCHWQLVSSLIQGGPPTGWPLFPDGAAGVGPGSVRFVVPQQTCGTGVLVGFAGTWQSSDWLTQHCQPLTAHRTDFGADGHDHITLFRPASREWLVDGDVLAAFGVAGDRPVPGDYDGDAVADRATYRPSDSTWRILRSSDGTVTTTVWGVPGDIPVPADYNGDHRLEIAVFQPSSATWRIQGVGTVVHGMVGDIPVPGHYDGLASADIAVFRPSTCTWFIRGKAPIAYGVLGDRPVPAQYTGDGLTHIAVYRPSDGWWLVKPRWSFGTHYRVQLGQPGDVAAPQDMDGDGRADPTVFSPSTGTWRSFNPDTSFWFRMSVGRPGDVVAAAAPAIPSAAPADTDGDRLADVTVFRPSDATWSTRRSVDLAVRTRYYGTAGDIPVPGDYLGTGTEQDAVYRPSRGAWFIQGLAPILFGGAPDDVPVPADYDGDGRQDVAVFRPSTSRWYILTSGSAFGTTIVKVFGGAGDTPLPGDYDGDGRADVALFRDATVQWWVLRSSDGQVNLSWFGNPGDQPMPADYDGDGRMDVAVYRPQSGRWFIRQSSSDEVLAIQFGGNPGDVPVSLDYDGDGRADVAVYNSTLGRLDVRGGISVSLGQPGDVPARTR